MMKKAIVCGTMMVVCTCGVFGGNIEVANIPDTAVLTQVGEYDLLTFTNNGSFTVTSPGEVDVLVVAGGGGGGSHSGGGGGGGGVFYITNHLVSCGDYTVCVGTGGVSDVNGGDSSIFGWTAVGGGKGGGVAAAGGNGGSGGGGGAGNGGVHNIKRAFPGGTGTDGQGYNGGASTNNNTASSFTSPAVGGGGGGGGGPGSDATVTLVISEDFATTTTVYKCGNGGNGFACAITGLEKYYGGGGGGGTGNGNSSVAGSGGLGGGGAGAYSTRTGGAGENLTGGGGGGGGRNANTGYPGGPGGSGVVMLRWKNTSRADVSTGKVTAWGGTAVWDDGYISRSFVLDGQLTFSEETEVELLMVAGGGGGSNG
ncbi:MAG TPA: hypothetical protein PK770_06235, partial [Kiritimatiellia bacterium]|nr:hypothetical protein [Kiritimatiellia bacterium]